jgi:uncharacterized protein YjbI with pentapeptide repeats
LRRRRRPLASGFCIFHDKDYLQDKTNNEEHKTKVLDRLKDKVNHAISNNERLLCIGFQLPDLNVSDLRSISKEFTMPVYFSGSQFLGKVVFEGVQFHDIASFREVQFLAKRTYFTGARFNGEAHFEKAQFLGEGYFPNAYFKVAFFTDTIFQGGEGYFPEANFHRSVDFRGAQFHSGSNFSLTTFEQGVDFSWSEFHGKTFFRSNFNNKT